MGKEDQGQFEDDDVGSLDEFDDDIELDDTSDDSEDSMSTAEKIDAEAQARIRARHEIERRNELKALRSELDEWDDLSDDDVL